MSTLSIGKGSNYSIAKAALIYYYEWYLLESKTSEEEDVGLVYGSLCDFHNIVDVAGAKQKGPLTLAQVSSRLYNSKLWKKETVKGFYEGLRGSGKAVFYKPSQRGKEYYLKNLKDKHQIKFGTDINGEFTLIKKYE